MRVRTRREAICRMKKIICRWPLCFFRRVRRRTRWFYTSDATTWFRTEPPSMTPAAAVQTAHLVVSAPKYFEIVRKTVVNQWLHLFASFEYININPYIVPDGEIVTIWETKSARLQQRHTIFNVNNKNLCVIDPITLIYRVYRKSVGKN